jgi:phage tail-like protein
MAREFPYSPFNFLVDLKSGVSPTNVTLGGFSEVTGLGQEFIMAEYRNGNEKQNHVRKVPGLHKVADVTLKRGVIKSKDLWDWIKAVRIQGPGGKRDVVITMLDEAGKTVQKWTLTKVVPMKYTGPSLNAKSSTDVAMEELVLAAESIDGVDA